MSERTGFLRLWDRTTSDMEIADKAFIFLRLIIFCGGVGWLLFSDIPEEVSRAVRNILLFFVVYSLGISSAVVAGRWKRSAVYVTALSLDLIFTSLLVKYTGGFESSFFNGFYLITALYSFYYGRLFVGCVLAILAAVLYYVSGGFHFNPIHWTDFSVRIAFLFLLAVPLSMLSQKLKKDKQKIENLNEDLEDSIDELKRLQEELIEIEKLSAIGRLTADVAHEIRNPLTSMGGFARRLHKKLSRGSREKEYADIVVSEVDRLERILRDVLTFSRESKNNMEYQQINAIVSRSVKGFAGAFSDQKIDVEESMTDDLPPVLIDSEQIAVAMSNLISNALDVMPDGGTLTVRSSLERLYEVDYVVVEVSDTGPGMSSEALHMIFEPFYTTKEIGIGTGLGLAVSKKIVDEHNGLLLVASERGKGTTFRLLFPHQSRENGSRTACWEFHRCGVENTEGAANMRCPAYPHYGRICWAVAGTFCGKKVSGAIAQKLGNCRKCEFYQRVAVRKDI